MAIEKTPLGYQIPQSASELVKNGAKVIGDNARKNQEHIAAAQQAQAELQAAHAEALAQASQDRAQIAALQAAQAAATPVDFDGGTPGTVYVAGQTIDGGMV